MASPEVLAAIISVAGSAVLAAATGATSCYLSLRRGKGKDLSQLRQHPLFRLHEDVELQIVCSDPVRGSLFNYIKNHVILDPVQTEVRSLLGSWADDRALYSEAGNGAVCDRLNRTLDNIVRLHTQRGREIGETEDIIAEILRPYHQITFRSIRDLMQTEYPPATLLALAVNLISSSLFTLLSDWNKRANMMNGHLNNLRWRGKLLRNVYQGSADTLAAHAKRWGDLIVDSLASQDDAGGFSSPVHFFLCLAEGRFLYVSPNAAKTFFPARHSNEASYPTFMRQLTRGAIDAARTSNATADDHAIEVRAGNEMMQAVNAAETYVGPWPAIYAPGKRYTACVEPVAASSATTFSRSTTNDEHGNETRCVLIAVKECVGYQSDVVDLHTSIGFILRAAAGRYDAVVTASTYSKQLDSVLYRSEASADDPLLAVGIPLQVNLGVLSSELQCVVDRAYRETSASGCSHLLRFGSLTYLSQRKVYVAALYILSGVIFALHYKCTKNCTIGGTADKSENGDDDGVEWKRNYLEARVKKGTARSSVWKSIRSKLTKRAAPEPRAGADRTQLPRDETADDTVVSI